MPGHLKQSQNIIGPLFKFQINLMMHYCQTWLRRWSSNWLHLFLPALRRWGSGSLHSVLHGLRRRGNGRLHGLLQEALLSLLEPLLSSHVEDKVSDRTTRSSPQAGCVVRSYWSDDHPADVFVQRLPLKVMGRSNVGNMFPYYIQTMIRMEQVPLKVVEHPAI